jgi:AmmeMemoRadiSam system protein B
MFAARQLGATQAHLVKYATSGDVWEDRSRVVGYAAVVLT